MEFLPPKIDEYVGTYTQQEPEILQELNRETHLNVLMPRMLSGHIQGRILSMFSQMIKPKNVLEIGTYTGYSALCFLEGLVEGGQIHTIDINEELQTMIQSYIEKANATDKIHLHIGNAIEIIPELSGEFDLVFIDADKENYSNYYDLVIDRVSKGGYIIADNVLWSGHVVAPEEEQNEETRELVKYSQKIHADNRVENVLMPVRDGLMIARKK